MKILVGQIFHETNTFSNIKTTVDLFKAMEWSYGDDIIKTHKGVRFYLGGMIDQAEHYDFDVIPLFSANATPSGTITKATYDLMLNNLLKTIKDAKKYDAICLGLHGAGVAEGIDDLEGNVLEAVREIAGDVPIVATLDLHANVTDKMVQYADVLLGVNFYPHIDGYERGQEAIDMIKQMLEGHLKPVMSLKKLPLMIPASTTNLSPAKDINELCWEQEKNDAVVDCTFFHGFTQSDIPHAGVSVLTITNDDSVLAENIAKTIAQKIWEKRDKFATNYLSPAEGIEAALKIKGNPIVLNETSDNPGGGAPGDGTYLLKAMLDKKLTNACFGCICDPEVAQIAHEVGPGSFIDVKLGGKTDKYHGDPLIIKAYVKSLSDGRFNYTTPMLAGMKVDNGKSARLQVGGVDIIVCSKKEQVFDEQIFLLHGIDVSKYKIVALKSSQHFRAAYEQISAKIITVESPGLSSSNLKKINYQRINRPMYPMDEGVHF